MPIASCWKPVFTKPEATIPATKYWLKVTPGAMVLPNTLPKMMRSKQGKGE